MCAFSSDSPDFSLRSTVSEWKTSGSLSRAFGNQGECTRHLPESPGVCRIERNRAGLRHGRCLPSIGRRRSEIAWQGDSRPKLPRWGGRSQAIAAVRSHAKVLSTAVHILETGVDKFRSRRPACPRARRRVRPGSCRRDRHQGRGMRNGRRIGRPVTGSVTGRISHSRITSPASRVRTGLPRGASPNSLRRNSPLD